MNGSQEFVQRRGIVGCLHMAGWLVAVGPVVELATLFLCLGPVRIVAAQDNLIFRNSIPKRMKIDRREHAEETVFRARPVSFAGREVILDKRQHPAVEFGGLGV